MVGGGAGILAALHAGSRFDRLVTAVRGAHIAPGTRVWAAGEAAAVQRIRRHLFEERAVPRARATVRTATRRGTCFTASTM